MEIKQKAIPAGKTMVLYTEYLPENIIIVVNFF